MMQVAPKRRGSVSPTECVTTMEQDSVPPSSSSPITTTTGTANNIKSKTNSSISKGGKQNWRSTGWTPLAYPSQALFQPVSETIEDDSCDLLRPPPSKQRKTTSSTTSSSSSSSGSGSQHGGGQWQRNPYFPLHRDVILAATRELLILDGSLGSSTLEVPLQYHTLGARASSHTTSSKSDANAGETAKKIVSDAEKQDVGQNIDSGRLKKRRREDDSSDHDDKEDSCKAKIASSTTNTENLPDDNTSSYSSIRQSSFLESVLRNSTSVSPEKHTSPSSITEKTIDDVKPISNNDDYEKSPLPNATITPAKVVLPSGEAMAYTLLQKCANPIMTSSPVTTTEQQPHQGNVVVPLMIKCKNDLDEEEALVDSPSAPPSANPSSSDLVMEESNRALVPMNSSTAIETYSKPIRKVSDVDALSLSGGVGLNYSNMSPHLAVVACNFGSHSIGVKESIDALTERASHHSQEQQQQHNHDGDDDDGLDEEALLYELRNDYPPLLDVSIMVETHLRNVAFQMVERLTNALNEKALREFMGYKSTAMKREKLLQLLADFLFDVSHAMFAWDQTEMEWLGNGKIGGDGRSSNTQVSAGAADNKIRNSLFDSRALKKIGGFTSSSLLKHALSIKRLRSRGVSWRAFAKTGAGKKMFRHYRDNKTVIQVGKSRRGQRIRRRLTSPHSKDPTGTRSRSSSIDSSDDSETKHSATVPCLDSEPASSSQFPTEPKINSTNSTVIPITLNREEGKSWGIQLVKDGSICVVNRAPETTDTDSKSRLELGDLIISMRNEVNETFHTPTRGYYHANDNNLSDWFGEAVSLFKRSKMLHLEVRRVESMPLY